MPLERINPQLHQHISSTESCCWGRQSCCRPMMDEQSEVRNASWRQQTNQNHWAGESSFSRVVVKHSVCVVQINHMGAGQISVLWPAHMDDLSLRILLWSKTRRLLRLKNIRIYFRFLQPAWCERRGKAIISVMVAGWPQRTQNKCQPQFEVVVTITDLSSSGGEIWTFMKQVKVKKPFRAEICVDFISPDVIYVKGRCGDGAVSVLHVWGNISGLGGWLEAKDEAGGEGGR